MLNCVPQNAKACQVAGKACLRRAETGPSRAFVSRTLWMLDCLTRPAGQPSCCADKTQGTPKEANPSTGQLRDKAVPGITDS